MKYIRTEYGIKETKLSCAVHSRWNYETGECIFAQQITADTIEELCDEFVIKYKDESKPRTQDLKELVNCLLEQDLTLSYHIEWLKNNYKDNLEFIKLGIWTDKGLIYVAKMNDKGELELL